MESIAEQNKSLNIVRRQMLLDFFATLDAHGIPYVVLAGYEGYPDQIDSDIDFMVSKENFDHLYFIFRNKVNIPGASLIQIFRHETSACYFVLAKQINEKIAYLHPDASENYRRRGRLWLASDRVLLERRKAPGGFWVPSPSLEFEYYFIKRVNKKSIELHHLNRFLYLLNKSQEECRDFLDNLFDAYFSKEIFFGIKNLDINWFKSNIDRIEKLMSRKSSENKISRLKNFGKELLIKLDRIFQPTGFVIAVLGPDGSGKTTIIEHLEKEFSPAFRKIRRFHLRPHFGNTGPGEFVPDPHGQVARGAIMSLGKLSLFLMDYWYGWCRYIWPSKVKSTLVIFDRYYHDMLVDSTRYRLPKNFSATKWFCLFIPKPDIWLILSASPELLVARKGEISLVAAQELNYSYENLAKKLPSSISINTDKGLEETLSAVTSSLLDILRKRCIKRKN